MFFIYLFRVVNCPDPECFDKPLEKDVVPHIIGEHFMLPEEVERACQEDKCMWVIEDSDFNKRSLDRTWPLSSFKFEVKRLIKGDLLSDGFNFTILLLLGHHFFLGPHEKCRWSVVRVALLSRIGKTGQAVLVPNQDGQCQQS